ncbi:MAG: hypothetical protein WBE78_01465 [Candidatus Binataceae bacterium]
MDERYDDRAGAVERALLRRSNIVSTVGSLQVFLIARSENILISLRIALKDTSSLFFRCSRKSEASFGAGRDRDAKISTDESRVMRVFSSMRSILRAARKKTRLNSSAMNKPGKKPNER